MTRAEKTTTNPQGGGPYDPAQNDCKDPTGQCDPIYTGSAPVKTVIAAPLGTVPAFTHYTMLVTKNANLCADAFIRSGVDVPVDIIARTLSVNTSSSNSLVTDSQVTTYPVMTIIDASQCNSSVMLQLLNPNGFYCFAGINSCRSALTIQKSCASKSATIEPMEINNKAATVYKRHWFWWRPVAVESGDGAFFGGYNQAGGSIKEVPCIP